MILKNVIISFGLIATVLPGPASAEKTEKQTWKTKVGSSNFRVTLDEQGVVNVVNKAIMTGRTMAVRDDMRIAVKQATGCTLTDELWFDAKLKGKLACPVGHTLPPGQ